LEGAFRLFSGRPSAGTLKVMAAFRLLVGVCLLAAPRAQAQRVVAPVVGIGRALPSAPIPQLTAPSILMPAPLLAPALAAPSALSLAPLTAAPVPARLAAVSAAVAQFSSIDLESAPAAEVRSGADALMARVLGEESAQSPALTLASPAVAEIVLSPSAPRVARAPGSDPGVHLLSKPLHETVELGPLARFLHYALELSFQVVQAGIVWQATGSPAAGAAVLAVNLIKTAPTISAQSLADMGLRYWRRKLAVLKRLADIPGVTRIRVLTTGETKFSGLLARRQENNGLVFLDASGPLPDEISKFGSPFPIADLEGRRVRLVLKHNGAEGEIEWTPALGELLSGKTLPPDVAAAWRVQIDAGKKGETPLRRVFDFRREKELRVEAYLSDGLGGETPLGPIAFGLSVKRLVGLGRLDRVGVLFGRAPVPRAIPLSDTLVERGGEKTVRGFFRRAWRRLTGALIVRP